MEKIKLLIVDDNAGVRRDLSLLFQLSAEIEVTGEAADGHEAVLLAEGLAPDAVLMDLEMPVMNGFEAARRIKTLRPALAVLALSAHNYPAARAAAEEAGCDGFLVKGTPLSDIIAQIIQAVEFRKR